MNLRQKLLMAGAGAGALAALLAAVIVLRPWDGGASAERDAGRLERLEAERARQAAQIVAELEHRQAALRALAAQRGTVDALQQFKAAWAAEHERLEKDASLAGGPAALRDEMLAWIVQQFAAQWRRQQLDEPPDLAPQIGRRSLVGAQLQQAFLVRNVHPWGERDRMTVPDTPSPYAQVHAVFHRGFKATRDHFGLDDLLLVDTATDTVLYSVAKDLDFATDLASGVAASSALAEVVGKVRRAQGPQDVALSDARPYLPAGQRLAMFVAVPVYDGDAQVGVLAARFAPRTLVASLDTLAAPWDGAAASGPTPAELPAAYTVLLGPDGRLRSDPPALRARPAQWLAEAAPALPQEVRALVAHRRSGVGLVALEQPAVHTALQKQPGTAVLEDARGRRWLAAYAALAAPGLDWVVLRLAPEPAAQPRAAASSIMPLAVAVLLGMVTGGAALALGIRRWMKPAETIQSTLERVAQGDAQARTGLAPGDELGAIGHAVDRLLDGRLAHLERARHENDALNQSVIGLLQTVFQLSNKDLTARAEVTEDIIGTLASSINQLGDEMCATLTEVQQIAEQVRGACEFVGEQALRVDETAQAERAALQAMASNLNQATYQLAQVAALSDNSRDAAEQASSATEAALVAVEGTVRGMDALRESIAEMEKRFKRLGERSQEISGVVNLINTISERTNVLALNASMQAAAAGEAGRGFATVAQEVQRLSESARQATAQIAQLVQSIQVETGDTLLTVNRLISQVVQQSAQAQQAGERMAATRETTAQLVGLVRQIADFSEQQATLAQQLRLSVDQLDRGSVHTILAIEQQTEFTATLVDYARRLSESVGQFRLPGVEPRHAEE